MRIEGYEYFVVKDFGFVSFGGRNEVFVENGEDVFVDFG